MTPCARFLITSALSTVAVVAPVLPVSAVDWPLERRVIVGTFGEDRQDHFSAGVELGGGGQPVQSVLDGELVFRYDAGDYSSVPRGTGSFLVLRHAQNILTMYAHLAEGSLGALRKTFTAGDQVGVVGDTGRVIAPTLSFAVYDGEAASYVNPLAFLPSLPDRQAPVIRQVILAVGDQRQELKDGVTVKAGKAVVLAAVYDLREDVRFAWPLAPYAVRLALDGTDITRISFDTLSVRDGVAVLGPAGLARADLYAGDGLLRLGTVDLHAGASHLLIAVRDYAGNETTRDIPLTIQGP